MTDQKLETAEAVLNRIRDCCYASVPCDIIWDSDRALGMIHTHDRATVLGTLRDLREAYAACKAEDFDDVLQELLTAYEADE